MMKPILFNTEMVRAILDGRKTVTRRVVKPHPNGTLDQRWGGFYEDNEWILLKEPYRPGDVLWVRETWAHVKFGRGEWHYEYRANCEHPKKWSNGSFAEWSPSIHMPREAARIFLRVTNVRVERLHDMTEDDVRCEGFENPGDFIRLWDSTIKPADRERYGWAANPWVWVIAFEQCEKPEETP